MELKIKVVGPWSVNTYVLMCPATRQSVLIDPGGEPEVLEQMLAGSFPQAILITHGHPDHIGALDQMRERLQVPVMAHPGTDGGSSIRTDHRLRDEEVLTIGNHHLRVYHAPGHASDQVCFRVVEGTAAIVGDTIFEGGPGKTWSSGDFQTTLATLRKVILPWPDEIICYPGHGPHFRLGDRRQTIMDFVHRPHGRFFGDATWEM